MSDLRIQLENVADRIILDRNGRVVLNEHRTYGADRFSQFEEDESLRVVPSGWAVTRSANGVYAVRASDVENGAVIVLRLRMPGDPARRGISLSATFPAGSAGSVYAHAYGSPSAADKTSSCWSGVYAAPWGVMLGVSSPSATVRWPDYRCRILARIEMTQIPGSYADVGFTVTEAATPAA